MIKVETAELYSCILDRVGCTVKEITDFLAAEIEYWNLPDSIYQDEDGDDTFDSDKMYDYLCEHVDLDEDAIEDMLNAQYDVSNDCLSLDYKYLITHNAIQMLKDKGIKNNLDFTLYQNCIGYGASILNEIGRQNNTELNKFDFLYVYMNQTGNYLNSKNYWVKNECSAC